MSPMMKQLFGGNPLVAWPMLALGIFVTVFVGIVFVVFARKAASFDEVAKLPLGDREGES